MIGEMKLNTDAIPNSFGKLFGKFKKHCEDQSLLKILEKVAIATPEYIHLNSFMYEPLIDTSTDHLKSLYQEVKKLSEEKKN